MTKHNEFKIGDLVYYKFSDDKFRIIYLFLKIVNDENSKKDIAMLYRLNYESKCIFLNVEKIAKL